MNEAAPATVRPVRLGNRGRLVVLGIWIGLGLLESARAILGARMAGTSTSTVVALVGNLPWWLAWAALTPIIIALARRFRFEQRPGRSLAIHTSAAILLAVLHHVVVGALFYFTMTRGRTVPFGGRMVEMTLARQLEIFFSGYFLLNVLTYTAVLGAWLGFEFYRRYREGEIRAARLEAGMHLARLEALRMELNPHFLFNSLNAVAGLVRRGENAEAVDVLARLGGLLRATLGREHDTEVPLERELDLLASYLDIERVRFRDRLTIVLDIDDAVREAAVPPLILQPLAENAIRHGIARRTGPGRLTVIARAEQGDLVLAIADEAAGETPADPDGNDPVDAEERRGSAGDDAGENGAGVGLSNVRSRLAELYGGRGTLRLTRRAGAGTTATLRMPLQSLLRSSREAATPGTSGSPVRGRPTS